MKRRRFTRDENLAALQPVQEGQVSLTARAAELGLGRTLLQRWRAELERNGEHAFAGSGQQSGAAAQLAALRRELRAVQQERDILKEAIRFFSQTPPPQP